MKKTFLFFVLIINSVIAQNQFESVTNFQKKLIQTETTGSNVAMIFKDGKIIYHHIENSLNPMGKNIYNNSIFPIWSMSKPITIVAMMTLKEKGIINFNDKVSKYIPEFEKLKCKDGNGGTYNCKKDLTVFHLMTHRSGYSYYGSPHFFTSTIKYNNLEDFIFDVANHPLEFEPGSEYLYGINMAILGKIVEVVTDKTFFEYLKEEIFDPLEMDDTKFYLTDSERKYFQPLWINNESLKGYTDNLDELTYDYENKAYFGGEGLVSTLADYSKFCQMLLNNGSINGHNIISKESINEMTQPYSKIPDDPFDIGYSLFVLRDSKSDGTNSSEGIFGWSGYHNTHFWIDREKNLFGLFMTRAREFSFEIQKEFRRVVYSSNLN